MKNYNSYKKHSYKKHSLLLTVVFLLSCQTVSNKEESQPEKNNVVPETAQKPVAASSNIEQQVPQSKNVKPDAASKTVYSQSRPPMSKETKKRLKSHAQELSRTGSMPRLNYQQPEVPGIQLSATGQPIKKKSVPVQLDYEQVEIRQILEEFADSLDMTIVIDPAISGTVTMRTAPNANLTDDDLWPLLQSLLTESGIVLNNRNGIYYAKRSEQLLPAAIGDASILSTTDASVVMQVTPLKHISATSAMTILRPILGPKGKISQIPSLNTLLIINKPEQLKRINGLLSLVDADPFKHRGIRLYKIKDAEAMKVAKELQDILKLIEGKKPAYDVMGLERVNALLVVAPPGRGFKDVDRWVDILDAGADEALVEQIFIYKCKSMKATSLAATLNSIFEQEDKTVRKEKPEESNNPNEFKTASREELSFKSAIKREANKQKGITTAPKSTDKKTKRDTMEEVASANINVTIVADEDTNSLLVRTTAKDYKHLLETIRSLDTVPLQVLINVVIAQVTLNDSQAFGIDWAYLGSSKTSGGTNFGLKNLLPGATGLVLNHVTDNWRVTLNALAKESDVNVLSRPSLLITNNDEGIINVGSEVPVETSSTTNTNSSDGENNNVTQQIAYRKTGIELTVTPHINEDGIIDMDIKQALSAVEGQTESGTVGLNPTFTNQEINTSIVIRDGETIILGGLIDSIESESESGVPVLKDVPIMGNLFKAQSKQIKRRELILIISTEVVNAEGSYDDFNNNFKNRYVAAARYLDKQLDDRNVKNWNKSYK